MPYSLEIGEILSLDRWLLKAYDNGTVDVGFLHETKQWLRTVEVDGSRGCKVQYKPLYRSFVLPTSRSFAGSFWEEVSKVLEEPILRVWRVNDLWKVGQKVWVKTASIKSAMVKCVVVKVDALGCDVRTIGHRIPDFFWRKDEDILPIPETVNWRPWRVLEGESETLLFNPQTQSETL